MHFELNTTPALIDDFFKKYKELLDITNKLTAYSKCKGPLHPYRIEHVVEIINLINDIRVIRNKIIDNTNQPSEAEKAVFDCVVSLSSWIGACGKYIEHETTLNRDSLHKLKETLTTSYGHIVEEYLAN